MKLPASAATVGLSVDCGRLVIEPILRPRYSLDELLAQCDASAEFSAEDRAWLDSKPVRSELLQWSAAIFTWCHWTRLQAMNNRGGDLS